MISSKETGLDLLAIRDLLLHSYDAYLAAQTRLFTLAHSVYDQRSTEIDHRQGILFLDDILIFAITGRRLIELTRLRAFANRNRARFMEFDPGASAGDGGTEGKIGFLTLLNSVIHCKQLSLSTHKFDISPFKGDPHGLRNLIRIKEKISRENRWSEYSIEPILHISPDQGAEFVISLRDVVSISERVAEKIIEVAGDHGVELEFRARRGE